MKKILIVTATCLFLLLGLTISAIAQGPAEPGNANPLTGVPGPELSITKSFGTTLLPNTYLVGQSIKYQIVVRNVGDSPATGVIVSDTLPNFAALNGPITLTTSAGDSAVLPEALPTLVSGATLAIGERMTVTIPVSLQAAGPITNTAEAWCTEVTTPVSATTWTYSYWLHSYVDGALGTDAQGFGENAGAFAYRTIQYAIDHAFPPGSVVHVAAGTYPEHVQVWGSVWLKAGATAETTDSQVIIDGAGSGTLITVHSPGTVIEGFTLRNADIGVDAVLPAVNPAGDNVGLKNGVLPSVQVRFCNLVDLAQWGIVRSIVQANGTQSSGLEGTGTVVTGTHNWWGDKTGPSGVGGGTGTAVSTMVGFDPWLGAAVDTSKAEYTLPGSSTIDASDETGIVIQKEGATWQKITVARYAGNPQADLSTATGSYWDVQLGSDIGVDSLTLTFYLTADEVNLAVPETLVLRTWNGSDWVPVDPQTLTLGEVVLNGVTYAATIEVVVTTTSTPSLVDLTGTEFALSGQLRLAPDLLNVTLTAAPERFCPGSTLYYTFRLANTQQITLTNVLVESDLPSGTCCLAGRPGSDVMPVYDTGSNHASWAVGVLGPGEIVTLKYSLHSYTSIVDGRLLTTTMTYAAHQLLQPGSVAVDPQADTSLCQVTPTPSPTPVVYKAQLPLIFK